MTLCKMLFIGYWQISNELNMTKHDSVKLILIKYLSFIDITVQPEHSQCPLVEMDFTTSQHILLCSIMRLLTLTFKSMVTLSARPMLIVKAQFILTQVQLHAAGLLLLLKVKKTLHIYCYNIIYLFCH